MNKHLTFLSALALTAGLNLHAQNANQMVIQANKIGAEIQPTMYGHFFEDINYGADGGLYAELIKTVHSSSLKVLWGGTFLEM